MKERSKPAFLGIECGATRTVALMADPDGRLLRRTMAGAANLRLVDDKALVAHLKMLAKGFLKPSSIAIGMAGARTERDFSRIREAAARTWPDVPCYATNDLETALAAAPVSENGRRLPLSNVCRVLILSGTGSCCFGVSESAEKIKVGGWGHILGDKGSGYEIGLRGLKASVYYYDRDGVWSPLGQRLLRKLALNEPNELIGWVISASKADIAALAVEVFAAWHEKDPIASDIIEAAANSLAKDGAACAKRLTPKGRVQFVLAGSVLLQQPKFAKRVTTLLKELWPDSLATALDRESAWGAVQLAMRHQSPSRSLTVAALSQKTLQSRDREGAVALNDIPEDLRYLTASPTETRNPRSMDLDKLSIEESIALMLSEDARIPSAILAERKKIAQTIGWIVQAFKAGGRLFYVGAGTSGRLGVLDASECPPTFRAPPDMVQGIIAGGQRAIWEAVEGAEDDPGAGAMAVEFRGVTKKDVVIGIAASGRTPFVWGALEESSRKGARTVLLCFNPSLKVQKTWRPDLIIAVDVGPEILTGSTRLKSGTATKLILNMFTTIAMVRIGKVRSNLMIDVKASNTKLRDRAVRIVQQLTNWDYERARRALENSNWEIKKAVK
ncbi:MAG TPA: N-acetylmuramic acid 6-phosphate etherase [Verrucomicrobiae bacterium]|nr:N-acetylmuramic acid 6-phosphate etherase [Verrucomicrobiae bacterium]